MSAVRARAASGPCKRRWWMPLLFVLLLWFLPGESVAAGQESGRVAAETFAVEPGPLSTRDAGDVNREPEALAPGAGGGFYLLRRDILLKHDAAGAEVESFMYRIDTAAAPALLDVAAGAGVWVLRRGGRIDRLDPDGGFIAEYNRRGHPVSAFTVDRAGRLVAALGLRYSPNTTRQIVVLDETGVARVLWEGDCQGRFIADLAALGSDLYVAALKLPLGARAFTDPDLSDREWIYVINSTGRLITKVILSENTEMEHVIPLGGGEVLLGSPRGLVRISSEGIPILKIRFSQGTLVDVAMDSSGDLLILDDSPEHEFVGVKRLAADAWREARGRLLDPPVTELFNQWDMTGGMVKRLDRAVEHERRLNLAGTTREVQFHLEQAVDIYRGLLDASARDSIKIRLRLAYLYRWLLHQPAEAARLLKEAVIKAPNNPVLHLLLADTLEAVSRTRQGAVSSYRAIPLVLSSMGAGTRAVQRHAWLSLVAQSRLAVVQPETVFPDDLLVPPILASRLGDVDPHNAEALFDVFYEQAALSVLGQFGLGELEWTKQQLAAFYEGHTTSLFAPVAAILLMRRLEADGRQGTLPEIEEWRRRLKHDWPADPCWLVLDGPDSEVVPPTGATEEVQQEE